MQEGLNPRKKLELAQGLFFDLIKRQNPDIWEMMKSEEIGVLTPEGFSDSEGIGFPFGIVPFEDDARKTAALVVVVNADWVLSVRERDSVPLTLLSRELEGLLKWFDKHGLILEKLDLARAHQLVASEGIGRKDRT